MYIEFPILSVTPAHKETNVALDTNIKIKFAQAMDDTTITPANIMLTTLSGSPVTCSLQYLFDTREVIIDPVSDLSGTTVYRVVVLGGDGGVKSITGDAMLENQYNEFTTMAATTTNPDPTPDPTTDPDPVTDPEPTSPVVGLLEISGTYPSDGDANIAPASIKLLFSAPVEGTTVDLNSIYVIEKKRPKELTTLDLLVDYSPSKSILVSGTNTLTLEAPNMVSISLAEDQLKENTEYTVIVRETVRGTDGTAIGEAYFFSFLSVLNPLYGNPDRIRADIGPFLRNISDGVLYQYMHEVSLNALDILTRVGTVLPEGQPVPNYVEQYVRYQTSYDLLLNAYLSNTNSSGSTRKLGDLMITQESGGSDISNMLREFKDRIKPWLDQMHGRTNRGYARPSVVVRGENVEAYPEHLSGTRTEFTDLEG